MTGHASHLIIKGTHQVDSEVSELAGVVADLAFSITSTDFDAAKHAESISARYFQEASTVEGDSLIAIMGARGSGKSTLLSAACMQLIDRDDALVLPIIRPEAFRSTTSLIAIVVGHFIELVERSVGDSADSPPPGLGGLVQRALKVAALAAPDATSLLARSSESLSQYALDAVGLLEYRDQLRPVIDELVVAVRNQLGLSETARIIVPLDDADLVPQRTLDILIDLRLLSAIPGVVPIICGAETDLSRHVEADLRRDFATDDQSMFALARQQINKTIRAAHIVEPPYIRYEKRLRFKPFGAEQDLFQLLERILKALDPDQVVAQSVLKWLELAGPPTSSSPVTGIGWLPETPRALEDLWLVANDLSESLESDSRQKTGPWLKKFLELVADNGPFSYSVEIERISPAQDGLLRVDAVSRWSRRISFSPLPTGSWGVARDDTHSRVRFRRFLAPQATAGDDEDPKKLAAIRSDTVSGALLLQDLFRLPVFVEPKPTVPSYIGGTDYALLQSVRMLGQETDDHFFVFPISIGGVQVQRAQEGWNELWRASTAVTSRTGASEARKTLARRFLTLVLDYWLAGESVDAIRPELETLQELVARAGSKFLELVVLDGDDPTKVFTPGVAFCYWFQAELPYLFHDLLIPPEELDAIVASWFSVVVSSGNDGEAIAELRQGMGARAQKAVTPKSKAVQEGFWFSGYSTLLSRLDSELLDSISHQSAEYHSMRSRGSLGKTVAEESVTVEESSGQFKDNVPSPEGDREHDLAVNVLTQLRS